jgi:hypothetical protein
MPADSDHLDSQAITLLEELDLGSARGGRGSKAARPIEFEIIRSLSEADIPLLKAPPPVRSAPLAVATMRHQHHQIAQLLAKGIDQTEVAFITGYSGSYISRLKTEDRAFQELLTHYAGEREAVFIDVLARMRDLGLSTLDELQARLADEPQEWSRRELLEMAELMLLKSQAPRPGAFGGAGGGAPAVSVNVKFVTAQPAGPSTEAAVDVAFEDIPG